MSGSFSDLPKFPGEARDDPPTAPAGPDTSRDRLRHLVPALVLIGAVGFGLFIAAGTAIILLTKAVDAEVGSGLVTIAAFLALPAVAVAAAVYQRHRDRQKRGWS